MTPHIGGESTGKRTLIASQKRPGFFCSGASADDPQGFVGHQVADPQAFFPGSRISPVAAQWISGMVEVAIVGRDHPSLGAVQE